MKASRFTSPCARQVGASLRRPQRSERYMASFSESSDCAKSHSGAFWGAVGLPYERVKFHSRTGPPRATATHPTMRGALLFDLTLCVCVEKQFTVHLTCTKGKATEGTPGSGSGISRVSTVVSAHRGRRDAVAPPSAIARRRPERSAPSPSAQPNPIPPTPGRNAPPGC